MLYSQDVVFIAKILLGEEIPRDWHPFGITCDCWPFAFCNSIPSRKGPVMPSFTAQVLLQ